MEYRTQSMDNPWIKWLAGVALGALAMYISDPAVGRQRRALLRDRMTHYRLRTQKLFNSRIRDARNRLTGLQAEATRFLAMRQSGTANPPVIESSAESPGNPEPKHSAATRGWVAGAVVFGLLTWWVAARRP